MSHGMLLAHDLADRSRSVAAAAATLAARRDLAQLRDKVMSQAAKVGAQVAGVRVLVGDASTAIVEYLDQEDFAYVFLGIRSRSRVGKLLFGSVTQTVLLGSPSKVVAVPVT